MEKLERAVIIGIIPGTEAWRMAMAACNKADKEFVPIAKRSKISKVNLAQIVKMA